MSKPRRARVESDEVAIRARKGRSIADTLNNLVDDMMARWTPQERKEFEAQIRANIGKGAPSDAERRKMRLPFAL
jgi:hypothetical protein